MANKITDLASRLRQRVTLQQAVQTADGAGGLTISWQDYATIWAEILPSRASESLFAGQLANNATHKITLRYMAGVDAKMRINYNGRIFDIISILNIGERNEMLQILVEEVLK